MFVIDRSLYLSPEVVGEPLRSAPLEVKVDPFSLEALVAWLEKQPEERRYDYGCNGHCLIAQYLHASGVKCAGVIPHKYRVGDARIYIRFPDQRFETVAVNTPHTFGAAKDRARKLLAEREK